MTILVYLTHALAAVNERLTQWARSIAGIFLAVMLVVVMSQVVFRYLLGSSLSWSEEVSKSLMVWSVFFVAPWAYRNGANVAIEALQRSFSPRFRAAVQLILNGVVIWVLVRFLWESLFFVARGRAITLASLPIDMFWIYLVTPASFAAMLLVGCEMFFRYLLDLLSGTPPPLRPIRPDAEA